MILTIAVIGQLNLFFLKNSENLLVRIKPEAGVQQVILYYSFMSSNWDSVNAQAFNTYFDAVITPPETINTIGLYFKQDNRVNDNNGALYIFEVKKSPRMIMPLSLNYLETIVKQARKKIINHIHIDEAITLIDYAEKILKSFPFIKGTDQEIKVNILLSEVNELKRMLNQ
jgi:hypothetical protein